MLGRGPRLAFLTTALLLAGCIDPPPTGTDVPLVTRPTSLAYGDCDELLGAFPVMEDAVPLPEGFAPAPFLGMGNGAIFLLGWQCATARDSQNASDAAPFVEAFAAFVVTVPEHLQLEGAFAHAVLLGLTTASPLAASTYEAWGIPATTGDVGFTWDATPIAATGTLTGAVGGLDIDMRVNAGGPNSGEEANIARFFVVEGDTLIAAYDLAWIAADGLQGQALSAAALPGAPPATIGVGSYHTSDDPARYTMTPFELPKANATTQEA